MFISSSCSSSIIVLLLLLVSLVVLYIYICIYIYIYIYNRHLGLINAPPPYLLFPPNDLFHYSTIKKARHIQHYGQDSIKHNYFPPHGGTPLRE